MAILYIHGVTVRSPEHGKELGRSFNRWLGPRVGVNGAPCLYLPVFWGDIAAHFRWDLKSRPPTALLKAGGAEAFAGLGSLRSAGADTPLDRALVSQSPT